MPKAGNSFSGYIFHQHPSARLKSVWCESTVENLYRFIKDITVHYINSIGSETCPSLFCLPFIWYYTGCTQLASPKFSKKALHIKKFLSSLVLQHGHTRQNTNCSKNCCTLGTVYIISIICKSLFMFAYRCKNQFWHHLMRTLIFSEILRF